MLSHDSLFKPTTSDEEWVSYLGERDWIAVTKDLALTRNQLVIALVRLYKIGLFALRHANLTDVEQYSIFMSAIPKMKKFIKQNSKPFIVRIRKSNPKKSRKQKHLKINIELVRTL